MALGGYPPKCRRTRNIEVEIYESAPAFKPVGAAILLAPNGLEVIKQLDNDLFDEVVARGGRIDRMLLTDQKEKRLGNSKTPTGSFSCAIHRATLIDILKSRIPAEALHVNKSFKNYQENADQTVKVNFEDGTYATGDFLVGTDGIKSKVRQQMLGDLPYRYSGQTCWRTVIPFQLPETYKNTFVEVWGKTRGLRVGFGAINQKEVYYFATYFTTENGRDNPDTLKAQLLELYQDFPPVVVDLIEATPSKNILRNDIHDLIPIRQWHQNNVVLVGDAAHATTPNMGQGGNQALESAWVLGKCIGNHEHLKEDFAQYQQMRMKKAHRVINNSWKISQMVNIKSDLVRSLRNMAMQMVPAKMAEANLKKVYELDYNF